MGERKEPIITLTVNGEELPITRDNLTVYRHLGANALYDHVFITTADEQKGVYIWRHNDSFEEISKVAEDNQSRIMLNIPEPSDHDREIYEVQALHDLNEATSVPEEWL